MKRLAINDTAVRAAMRKRPELWERVMTGGGKVCGVMIAAAALVIATQIVRWAVS